MAFDNKNRGNNRNQNGKRPFRRDNNRPQKKQQVVEEKVWEPKTQLGKDVLAGKYNSLREVLLTGKKIMESEIVDTLEPNFAIEYINVGQAKGKFGGGKRKTSKATQKITMEGSTMSFQMVTVTGNKDGIVGLGFGKSRETVPSREKAIRNGKLNLALIRRGCGDWGCFCGTAHSIPFAVEGVSGS